MTSDKMLSSDTGLTAFALGNTDIQCTIDGVELVFMSGPLSLPPELGGFWRAEEKRRLTGKLLEDCVSFLRNIANMNQPSKKETLRKHADEYLGQKVPTRIFNEAYQRVFKRCRGRPRTRR